MSANSSGDLFLLLHIKLSGYGFSGTVKLREAGEVGEAQKRPTNTVAYLTMVGGCLLMAGLKTALRTVADK